MGDVVKENGREVPSEMGRAAKKREFKKWVLIVSFLIIPLTLLIVFTYLPLFDMVKFSFYKWNGISKTMKFVGAKNYIEFFTKQKYWSVLITSLYYLIGSLIQIAIALYFATVLNYNIRCKNLFKGIIFFPY